MKYTIAFDVYGTLINTSAIQESLEDYVGEQTQSFMDLWRNKQLEYSFRRGLMNLNTDFSVCTKEALDYCCLYYEIYLSGRDKKNLIKAYDILPAYKDAGNALKAVKSDGHKVYAFSNGSKKIISDLLKHNGLDTYFNGIISTEDVKTFKPSPVVYEHLVIQTKSKKEDCWLISGNSFDIIGAASYGIKTAWIQRSSDIIFDPWGIEPSTILGSLSELPEELDHFELDVTG